MNDPHIASLTYRLEKLDCSAFDAPALDIDVPECTGRLDGDTLTLIPKQHFATEDEARDIADEFVRDWRVHAGLQYGSDDFRLQYSGAQVVDRSPKPGHQAFALSERLYVSDDALLHLTRNAYPDPPSQFTVTPVVEVLWERFVRYKAGSEPILSMAYFCVTVLAPKDRRASAQQLNVEYEILDTLAELSSTRGDSRTARKSSPGNKPLTPAEAAWIEAAIKAITRHLGEGGQQTLRMNSLPPI